MITAAHCVDTQDECDNAAYIFNYYVTGHDENGNPTFPEITVDDVVRSANERGCDARLSQLTSLPPLPPRT